PKEGTSGSRAGFLNLPRFVCAYEVLRRRAGTLNGIGLGSARRQDARVQPSPRGRGPSGGLRHLVRRQTNRRCVSSRRLGCSEGVSGFVVVSVVCGGLAPGNRPSSGNRETATSGCRSPSSGAAGSKTLPPRACKLPRPDSRRDLCHRSVEPWGVSGRFPPTAAEPSGLQFGACSG